MRPDAPSPKTATRLPAKHVIGVISPQLQCREADEREDEGDDPESHHDLRLRPTELFEMMVDRSHLEDTLAGQLERYDLDDHGERLDHEETADDGEHDLVFDRDRNRAEQSAQSERARVPHKNLRGRRIEPEKAEAGADQSAADHGELTGAGHEINAKI